ncbi:hypothetical protein FNF29_02257 [Cafeteria roenbergensis]|uniref:Uncharacterized protein n=1 Tax=Cafeteria roenbergensis TaxID=33653 RepID=A0A5A8CCF2_CAFRO|nr:hypothetical protein FNF31_06961 [Cafeteria roenbergensis]KAA0154728.1 hypothetical protein FNF29_02257 [Cafeteria roenbergensis]|eukprot:KAA0154728.1 hypothetical protein FNF29_02257 [Cafeteria roenbergensis]
MIMQMKLSHASAAGDAAAVAEILDAGANSGTPDLAGLTPLHHAATNGEPAVIELLVARGASPDTPAANAAGGTPLHCAAGNGQDGACACLLRLGADPSLRNLKGHLPEDLARAFGAAGVLRMLARARQDADAAAAAEAEEGRSDGNSDRVSPEELARVVDQQSRVVTVRATVVASLSARQGDPVTPSRPLVLASPGDTTLADLWRRGRMPGRAPPQGLGLERDRAGRTEDEEDDAGTPRLAPASGASPLRGRVAVPGSAAAESGRVVDLYDAPFSEEVPADGAPGPAPGTARDAEPPRAAGAARAAPAVAGFAQGTNPTGAVPPVLQSSAESVASLVLGGRAAEARLPGVVNDADPLSSVSDDDEEFDEEEEAAAAAAEYGGSGVEGAVAGRAEGRDGRVSAVSVSRFALLQPLQHLFRCVLPPKLARLEGRVVAAVGSASLDDALAVHPHVLRRKLKALGVRKKDRDAIVAGMRPLRDAAGHGEGARPYLQAVAAAEQAGLP